MQQNILEKLASLPPEKRKLLELMLQEEQIDLNETVILPHSQDRSVFPLSFAQERLWFLNQLEPNNPAYNIPLAVRIDGRLQLPVLKQTIAEIVRRHALLRTVFATEADKPVQIIVPEIEIPFSIADMRGLPDTAVQQRIAQESQRIFNLAEGPLFHVTLIQRGDEEHVIILTMHHIISDGWSMGILMREIGLLYSAFLAGRPSPLPDLPIQYADFALWQRQWLQGEALETQLAYWKEQLTNCPPLLELPTDRPRPPIQTNRGARVNFALSPAVTQALHDLSREKGATLFMTLLAAFQTLLYRYTGQTDICVGTPIANRSRSDLEDLVGFFVNTLVLRADFSGAEPFSQLLEQVRETTINAFANQDFPFEMLVETLNVSRNLSHTPLFQVMFSLGNTPMTSLTLPGLTLTPLETDTRAATFDLTLAMNESPDGLQGSVEYNTDLFDPATMERLIGHFQTLLAGIAADPDTAVTRLPLLTETEWQQIQAWNDTAVTLPENHCVHHLIAQKAAETPEAVALIHDAEQWSYRQLNQRANQLAHYLQQQGVGPDKPVGVALSRSPEMIVALLGILKAGGAYLPLDPDYPPERLVFMIEDAQPCLILTDSQVVESSLSQVVESSGSQVVLMSNSQIVELPNYHTIQLSDYQTTRPPDYQTDLDSLAYVIYTSGSTGRPKGVMIPHRGLLNHNLAVIDLFGLTAADRVWQFATINFDTAVEEIFPTLIAGATLVLRGAEIPPVSDLNQIIADQQLTILDLPTAYWHAWAHDLAHSSAALPDCLRLVVVGGDKVETEGLRLWQKAVRDTAVTWLNTYGPTETTIIATSY
ncbi:MAG TPA: non-ribosomal peptide synthetase, partial [Anaerolineae bacterium]|nr:non-ribosomal peptide synthetase [Anaerolineae bacterium]